MRVMVMVMVKMAGNLHNEELGYGKARSSVK
jgi:hypothetical protein